MLKLGNELATMGTAAASRDQFRWRRWSGDWRYAGAHPDKFGQGKHTT
jgi:hypothetical protein